VADELISGAPRADHLIKGEDQSPIKG